MQLPTIPGNLGNSKSLAYSRSLFMLIFLFIVSYVLAYDNGDPDQNLNLKTINNPNRHNQQRNNNEYPYDNEYYYDEEYNYEYANQYTNDDFDEDDGVTDNSKPNSQAFDDNSLVARSLDTFKVTNLLLASDIEGNLHALNRNTGELVWTLMGNGPLVSICSDEEELFESKANSTTENADSVQSFTLTSMFASSSYIPSNEDQTSTGSRGQSKSNSNNNVNRRMYTQMAWMIEPFDEGSIYYFTHEDGLQKLPTSIKQLIHKSPFSIGEDFVYTGVKKSGIVRINAKTGNLIDSFGFDDSFPDSKNNKLDESCTIDEHTINENNGTPPVILLGKTTYELTIHSKNATSWNITYTSWGPNNLHSNLIDQNFESTDNLYIQPFHDNSLLALDAESKSVKWVSSLSDVTVNVFDVFLDNDEIEDNEQSTFIVLPHPLNKKPFSSSMSGSSNSGQMSNNHGLTFIERTKEGSWFAMSENNYPSLVKSAPLAKYIANERWRTPPVFRNPELLGIAISGVHDQSLKRGKEQQDLLNVGGGSGTSAGSDLNIYEPARFPTIVPTGMLDDDPRYRDQRSKSHNYQQQQQRRGRYKSRNASNNNNRLGLPPSDYLSIDPPISGPTSTHKVAPLTMLVYRAFENVLVTIIGILIIAVLSRFGLLPPLTQILSRFGLFKRTQSAVELVDLLLKDDVVELEKSFDLIKRERFGESPSKDVDESTADGSEIINTDEDFEEDAGVDDNKSVTTISARKQVKIDESPEIINPTNTLTIEDDISKLKEDDSLPASPFTPKKRKRGSRGGKKNKKKESISNMDDIIDLPSNELTISSGSSSPISATVLNSSMTISNEILGYGSHGTIVFKGSFENRPVAVKRMLIDFYDVASHEINLLQESDDHPNVVRYFCSQQSNRFLFIALELCGASLEDVIECKNTIGLEINKRMNKVDVIKQIANGLNHLHSLNIVHRDIKPQNILVVPPKFNNKDDSSIRLLISDFGLCKKLENDQSSFRATTAQAAGTSGWRAPELLLDDISDSNSIISESNHTSSSSTTTTGETVNSGNRRLTRSIDIFSLGCVFYYILSNGYHPFGDRYLREGNIIKNNYNLDLLDSQKDCFESKDLISSMISMNPKERPNMIQIIKHPYFWSVEKKLDFLLKVSDRFEIERRDPPSNLLLTLESFSFEILGEDGWFGKFDELFMDNLGKYRKYNNNKLMDLLRAMRNKYHHYQDLPDDLLTQMSPLPRGFYFYFMDKFPNMLLVIYQMVEKHLKEDESFKSIF